MGFLQKDQRRTGDLVDVTLESFWFLYLPARQGQGQVNEVLLGNRHRMPISAPLTQSKTQGSDVANKALHDLILLPLWPHPPLHRPPTFSPSDWRRETAWGLPWCRSCQPLSRAARVKRGLGFSPVFSGREQNAQTKCTVLFFSAALNLLLTSGYILNLLSVFSH